MLLRLVSYYKSLAYTIFSYMSFIRFNINLHLFHSSWLLLLCSQPCSAVHSLLVSFAFSYQHPPTTYVLHKLDLDEYNVKAITKYLYKKLFVYIISLMFFFSFFSFGLNSFGITRMNSSIIPSSSSFNQNRRNKKKQSIHQYITIRRISDVCRTISSFSFPFMKHKYSF